MPEALDQDPLDAEQVVFAVSALALPVLAALHLLLRTSLLHTKISFSTAN